MSLTRQFFNEMRPFFRLLEEPFIRPFAGHQHHLRRTALFDQPFFERPALDLSEQKDGYVVEAEVPGVKKEDLNIRIGDSGRSLTIEGRARYGAEAASHPAAEGEVVQSSDSQTSQAVTKKDDSNALTSERSFVANTVFSRMIWLPHPVDGSQVSAKLQDGILTLRIPKAEDKGSIKVDVE